MKRFFRSPRFRSLWPLLVGVLYGLCLRLAFALDVGEFSIVSKAFLLMTPFSLGALAVFVAARGERTSVRRDAAVAAKAMILFLIALFLMLLEGVICIVLVLPVFVVAAVLGGVLAGWLHRHMLDRKGTVSAFALLPLLLGPIEAALPPVQSEQLVSTTMHIAAPPEAVFDQLADVRGIRPEELGFAFVHLIGLPKPIEADMHGSGAGAVRVSRWEKNVRFEEVITHWQRPQAMHYRFHIPPGSIPRDALDEHVELGGKYFTVLDGGYDLAPAPDGGTELTLTTRFLNKSQLKLYGDLWGRMVLQDFHRSILGLMRRRAERA
ncbi:SRPBCC family protein [Pseudoduganella armeniaca]|nr:SRPBCC family protein [Pseudoduganella armeniaca]